jgi:hypothetical protein
MSFSQLFPLKDATLSNQYPVMNTGLDPILELSKPTDSNPSRIVIQFDQGEIENTLNSISSSIRSGSNFQSYLRLYASEVESLPAVIPVLCNPISLDWDQGTGRFGNIPQTQNGVSWTGPKVGQLWTTSSGISTSSYASGSFGGGSWYTGYTTSQSISQYTPQDLYINVTDSIQAWVSGTINNNGFILRVSESIELSEDYKYQLNYFGRDTNTIYPPTLLFYWDSHVYNPESSSILVSDEFNVALGNNNNTFQSEEIVKLRVYSREKFPPRTFVTQSLYTYNKILPETSYYQIIDIDTNESIIPFNNPGTQLSADSTSSYFHLNMNYLEPERYYTVQIKTEMGSSSLISTNNNMMFKTRQVV